MVQATGEMVYAYFITALSLSICFIHMEENASSDQVFCRSYRIVERAQPFQVFLVYLPHVLTRFKIFRHLCCLLSELEVSVAG